VSRGGSAALAPRSGVYHRRAAARHHSTKAASWQPQ